ncbi:MAG TPA: hypothetical protein VNT55_13875 [Baekduia sp.]|nr:hypothetical protein [Baekduia sp.]
MVTVRRTTPLPISAEQAFALAQKPETFAHVVRGVMRVPGLAGVEGDFAVPGARASGRLWWLGVIPSWTHHLEIVAIGPGEIRTAEHGGLVRTWNHRLLFVATSPTTCEYTDEIEIEAVVGVLTPLVAAFARAMFALRQARWRRMTA